MNHPGKPSNFSLVDPSALQSPQKSRSSTATAIHPAVQGAVPGRPQGGGLEGGEDETPFMTEGADEILDTSLMSGLDDEGEVRTHY